MNSRTLSRASLRRTAARWHDSTHSGHTYCLPPGRLPAELSLPEDARAAIEGSETGAFLFWSLAGSHLVLPPFPVEKEAGYPGWHTGPIQSLLDKPRSVLVVLLRLGGFAIGVFEGERLVTSKVGAPFVKGRHKKGGSSSGRFARRREEQARTLFDKACETLRQQMESYGKAPQHMATGGDRLTLLAFEKRCPAFAELAPIRQRRVLDVPDPRLKVLKDTPRLLYESRLIAFTPASP